MRNKWVYTHTNTHMNRYMGKTSFSLLATNKSRKKGNRKAPFGNHYNNIVFSQETSRAAKTSSCDFDEEQDIYTALKYLSTGHFLMRKRKLLYSKKLADTTSIKWSVLIPAITEQIKIMTCWNKRWAQHCFGNIPAQNAQLGSNQEDTINKSKWLNTPPACNPPECQGLNIKERKAAELYQIAGD